MSGRDLHNAVAEKATLGMKALYQLWRRNKKIGPFIIAWPLPNLDFKGCLPTNSEVVLDLPENKDEWPGILSSFIERTEPFALLLAQQKEKEVVLVLESEFGSSSWHLPITKHGPDLTLGQPSMKTDTDCIGLLWKAGAKN